MSQNENEIYKRIKLLGEGSFGKAYLVECIKDHTLCVIKQVDLGQMKEDERRETIKEARILEALRHPNIVKFREVYKTKKGRLCIVMDYADGGDLGQKIKQAGTHYFSEVQVLDWFTQICLAIKHVHDRKIIHRDLKTQNIFLTQDGIIKLGDFGIARVLNHTREKCKTIVGTPYYLSPEIIESKDYSFKTDIWSLGVILYELCALKPPFNAESLHGLALKIVRGQYNPIPDRYSSGMKQLIQQLLSIDPIKRPGIHDVLKMPIIVNRIRSVLSESIRMVEFSHTILHKQNFVNNDLQVPYDTELRSVHSQPNLGKQQEKQSQLPQNYLLALNARPQPLSHLQKQKQIYQQHIPCNYEYFSKQVNNNAYPPSQHRYLGYQQQQQKEQQVKQPLSNANNRPNISPINNIRPEKSPLYEDKSPLNAKSPMQRDKSPFELQREQIRQQIKKNEERVQQLQENRQKYLQQEKPDLPKLSREPYSQPQLIKQQQKDQKEQKDPIKLEPIRVEPIRVEPRSEPIRVEPRQEPLRIEGLKLENKQDQQFKEQVIQQPQQQQQAIPKYYEIVKPIETPKQPPEQSSKHHSEVKTDPPKSDQPPIKFKQMKESQLILQEIREMKSDQRDERDKMKQLMEIKRQMSDRNNNNNKENTNDEQQHKQEQDEDNEASQLLAELEDLVICAEGGDIKESQVIDVPEMELLNMLNIRESVDREDDESLDGDGEGDNDLNGEREELDDEHAGSVKELLYNKLVNAVGQECLGKFISSICQLQGEEYIEYMSRGFDKMFEEGKMQEYKGLLFIYECM